MSALFPPPHHNWSSWNILESLCLSVVSPSVWLCPENCCTAQLFFIIELGMVVHHCAALLRRLVVYLWSSQGWCHFSRNAVSCVFSLSLAVLVTLITLIKLVWAVSVLSSSLLILLVEGMGYSADFCLLAFCAETCLLVATFFAVVQFSFPFCCLELFDRRCLPSWHWRLLLDTWETSKGPPTISAPWVHHPDFKSQEVWLVVQSG